MAVVKILDVADNKLTHTHLPPDERSLFLQGPHSFPDFHSQGVER